MLMFTVSAKYFKDISYSFVLPIISSFYPIKDFNKYSAKLTVSSLITLTANKLFRCYIGNKKSSEAVGFYA